MALVPEAPPNMIEEIEQIQVNYLELQGPTDPSLMRNDFVLFGDSQLHSAVYGSGLPEFIMAEVGGRFRWGSKSGLDLAKVYHEIVSDNDIQPRVVVVCTLMKYYWYKDYDKKSGKPIEAKYRQEKMPPYKGGKSDKGGSPGATTAAAAPIQCSVRITAISKSRPMIQQPSITTKP